MAVSRLRRSTMAMALAMSFSENCMLSAFAPLGSMAATAFVEMPAPAVATQRPRRRRLPTFRSASSSSAGVGVNKQDSSILVVPSMPEPIPPLKNKYYLLRHGQSTANVAGIISSARSLAGSTKHGLTALGREQGVGAATDLLEAIGADLKEGGDESTKRVIFYSSPFARAKETAYSCLEGLRGPDTTARTEELGLTIEGEVALDDGLMERFFGRLDGMELSTYAYVWPVDMFEPTHTGFDVESVAAVSTRIREALLRIDANHNEPGGNHIVLTSHADVLQITQVYAAGLDNVGKFSQYRFGNGEVRRMQRTVDSLPDPVPLQPPKRGQ